MTMVAQPVTDRDVRCWRCGRLLAALLTRPWKLRCQRCNADNASAPLDIHP